MIILIFTYIYDVTYVGVIVSCCLTFSSRNEMVCVDRQRSLFNLTGLAQTGIEYTSA